MYTAFVALAILIGVTPAMLIIDGAMLPGLTYAAIALALVFIAWALHDGEAAHLRTLFWPIAIVVSVPAAWIYIQALPITNLDRAHPIWKSAAIALGNPLIGSLSIDRGATFTALCNYLLVVAIMFVATAVSVDRHRAKWALLVLTGATATIAVMVSIQDVAGIKLLSGLNNKATRDTATNSIALGAILAATATVLFFNQHQRHQSVHAARSAPKLGVFASLAAFAICTLTVILFGTIHGLVAVASGLVTLISIVLVRRFSLGPWGGAGVAITAIVVAVSVVAIQAQIQALDPTLAFAPAHPLLSITQRMLNEGTWSGSGAGTFGILVPIYSGIDDVVTNTAAPTTASAIAVELGRPALWAAAIIAILTIFVLSRGAVLRGRDSLYPAAGASCMVTAIILAFANNGMLGAETSIIFATAVGLAFAQSRSRTAR